MKNRDFKPHRDLRSYWVSYSPDEWIEVANGVGTRVVWTTETRVLGGYLLWSEHTTIQALPRYQRCKITRNQFEMMFNLAEK